MIIPATVRNEFYQEGHLEGGGEPNQQRVYIHNRTRVVIEQGQFDRDLEDESTFSWEAAYRHEYMDRLLLNQGNDDDDDNEQKQWITDNEHAFFSLWNAFLLNYHNRPQYYDERSDTNNNNSREWDPVLPIHFVRQHSNDLRRRGLEQEVYLFLIRLWELRKISAEQFKKLIYLYEVEVVRMEGGGESTRTT